MFEGYIYAIRALTDPLVVKIGFSANPERRLAQLRTGSADTLELVAAVPGMRCQERVFHAVFDEYRTAGEWFREEGFVSQWVSAASFVTKMMDWGDEIEAGGRADIPAALERFGRNAELVEALIAGMSKTKAHREFVAPLAYNNLDIDPSGDVMRYGLQAALRYGIADSRYVFGAVKRGIKQGQVPA